MKKKKSLKLRKIFAFLGFNLVFAAVLSPFIVFWGPFQSLKELAVGSIATSRHPWVLDPFLSKSEVSKIMDLTDKQGVDANAKTIAHTDVTNASSGITIENIQ